MNPEHFTPRVYEKFMGCVIPVTETGCWLWIGAGDLKLGYGRFYTDKKTYGSHRWSYEYHKGAIPDGFVIDHKCRVPACVNPAHLRAVTPKVNAIENSLGPAAKNAVKTHCSNGHEYTPENIYTPPNKNERMCRVCLLANKRKNDSKRRELLRAGRKSRTIMAQREILSCGHVKVYEYDYCPRCISKARAALSATEGERR